MRNSFEEIIWNKNVFSLLVGNYLPGSLNIETYF